jgi:hypothetical protein
MSDLKDFLSRVVDSVNNTYSLHNLAPWIEKHTYLDGSTFSFKDHEFQREILADKAPTSIVVKCAQIGLSELSYRYAVAACCTQDDFTVIYTFPASADAEKNCKTRIDPMISGSPELGRLVSPNLNNSEVKQFGRNSFLFFKGTFSSTQALSTPANAVIHDEWDKSDTTQGSVYVSRLQHKPHKLRKIFSTPTVERFGVSKEAETAKRFKHLVKCNCCSHMFLPDYFEHIKVPGWDKPLEEINKRNIHEVRWKEAQMVCPKCGKDPQMHHTRMFFVCENPSENHEAHAWYVSPFSAHNLLTPSYLVNTSTKFERYSEFKNQTLGLTAEEKNESIVLSDIVDAEMMGLRSGELHVMGSDMGVTCHICIGRIASDGTLVVVHRERVNYTMFEKRSAQLAVEFKVVVHVMDSQPEIDLVTRITKARPNNWGAIFTSNKSTQPFALQSDISDPSEGKLQMKLVKINRTVALDNLLGVIKSGKFVLQSSEENELYREQMLSLKRVQKFTSDGELVFTWQKTDGSDHYHFATLYLWIATQMRGTAGSIGSAGLGLPLAFKTAAPKYGTHGSR